MFDPELDSFKTKIDLRAYAAGQGYQLDRKESWRGSAVMRHQDGDKIIIKRDSADGHFVYFSVHRDDDKGGSIVDFIQHRQRMSLGAVRKELRPWIGMPPVPVPSFPVLHESSRDRMRVEREYAKMSDALRHPYLGKERALPASVLGLERFAGRIRIDAHANAIFPHTDADGICGYEIKNVGFTGFSSGGAKGLWLSHEFPDDKRLIFCESAIDALSHAALFPDDHARYASIGGKPNPVQPELIRAAIARMPVGSEIVAAMDADEEGAKLAGVVHKAYQLTGRLDLRYAVHEPFGFKDWNDQLRKEPQPHLPHRTADIAPV